jgi:uncharacterized membrane protein
MGFCCNGFGWGGMGHWGGMGTTGWILGLVLTVGLLAILGLAIAWLLRQFRWQPALAAVRSDPLETARRRLAVGEITVAQFEAMRERLRD